MVSTPIGNLEDITLRALRVLRDSTLIAAEDTRHTRRLLNHYDIVVPCISYHEHNKLRRLDDILSALANGDVALVSDAGAPALSDPGFELVNACIAAGFPVTPIPGPSAPIAALTTSGLSTDRFLYVGFLPRRSGDRRALFENIANLAVTLVCFETPHRLRGALNDIHATLGDRQIAVANDLTKRFETILRGTVSQMIERFAATQPRGEFTLVIAGQPIEQRRRRDQQRIAEAEPPAAPLDEATIARRLTELRDQGFGGSAAARIVASETDAPKSAVYQIWLRLDDATQDD